MRLSPGSTWTGRNEGGPRQWLPAEGTFLQQQDKYMGGQITDGFEWRLMLIWELKWTKVWTYRILFQNIKEHDDQKIWSDQKCIVWIWRVLLRISWQPPNLNGCKSRVHAHGNSDFFLEKQNYDKNASHFKGIKCSVKNASHFKGKKCSVNPLHF